MDGDPALVTSSLSCSQSLFMSGALSVLAESVDGFDSSFVSGGNPEVADYEMEEKLGEGTYGLVVAAKCLTSASGAEVGCRVAIKMVSSAFQKNTLLAKRTLREVAMLRRFSHDNLISVLDFYGSCQSRLFMVLPLMDTDLAQIIDSDQPLRTAHM
jgi:serine/threonine protein kinase